MDKFIIVWGTAFNGGLTLTGPFDTHEDAHTHAEQYAAGEAWEIVELALPRKDSHNG